MFDLNKLCVSYCCSDLFAEVLAVSITSLFFNNKEYDAIEVYVLEDKISSDNKDRLSLIAKQYGREIVFIELPDPSLYFNDKRFTIQSLGHTYARLILGDILPKSVGRVLSLDSDTIIRKNVNELWSMDLTGYYMAGVDDCMGATTMEKILGVAKENNHCNAGMFLMDLTEWRNNNLGTVFTDYMLNVFNNEKPLAFYEEEVINNTIIDKIKIVSPKFDFMTVDAVFSYEDVLKFRKPAHYYSKEIMQEAKADPVIIHSTTLFYVKRRIFEENSKHPYRSEYVKYKQMTPWMNEICNIQQRSIRNNVIKTSWHLMPKWLMIRVASFVRNNIRPFLKKKRDDE